jgi:hypothetical protein
MRLEACVVAEVARVRDDESTGILANSDAWRSVIIGCYRYGAQQMPDRASRRRQSDAGRWNRGIKLRHCAFAHDFREK